MDEVAILRRRTKAFLNRALDSLEAKDYDVASFLSEQAVQLYLKSLLLEELGDYPRTHSISTLLTILGKVEKYKNVAKILEIKKREIRLMEDAYISLRYLVREFDEEEAQTLIKLAKEIIYGKIC
ncbi:MAG: HEPN domain-containing protein [Candidatus Verstraetearchaeota archaeon]|nr:HEPN domain-containing protein [Candidatus Verstraetearchaeota archaeon]